MNLWSLGSGQGGIVREFRMDMYTLLYLKWITSKALLSSTGTLLNVMEQPGWMRILRKNGRTHRCG